MRLMVRHETVYRYASPASAVIQHLRMTPRAYDGFFIRNWRVEIDADYLIDRGEDAFGNILHTYTAEGPVDELRIVVTGDVETSDTAGVMRSTIERFPLIFWQRETTRTAAGAAISEWAGDVAAGEGGDTLAALHALNASLFRMLKVAPSIQDSGLAADAVFAKGGGTPVDCTHVLIAGARCLDVPARCVSGYRLPDPAIGGPETRHTWMEAHIPGIGWIGFDPANGLSTTDAHIRVAHGLDYLDCAPVRGAQTGGSTEVLAVEVAVRQGPVIIDV
jgi:transglutaminase-like putative cysteine protease